MWNETFDLPYSGSQMASNGWVGFQDTRGMRLYLLKNPWWVQFNKTPISGGTARAYMRTYMRTYNDSRWLLCVVDFDAFANI